MMSLPPNPQLRPPLFPPLPSAAPSYFSASDSAQFLPITVTRFYLSPSDSVNYSAHFPTLPNQSIYLFRTPALQESSYICSSYTYQSYHSFHLQGQYPTLRLTSESLIAATTKTSHPNNRHYQEQKPSTTPPPLHNTCTSFQKKKNTLTSSHPHTLTQLPHITHHKYLKFYINKPSCLSPSLPHLASSSNKPLSVLNP